MKYDRIEDITNEMIRDYLEANPVCEAAGSDAAWWNINEEIGIKFYLHAHQRDFSYDLIEKLHTRELAPKVYQKIDCTAKIEYLYRKPQTYELFGFIMERVKVRNDIEDYEEVKNFCLGRDLVVNELLDVCKEMNPPYEVRDVHTGNFGINKQNKMVIIDVGHFRRG